jgi:predicted lipid-binding transport protein (Tim44 family)
MKYTSINRGIPAGNPIANALVIIVGALAIGASIVLGFFAFIVLASIVLVLGSIIGLRVWWLNRKLARAAQSSATTRRSEPSKVIEGEYHVVKGDEKP